MMQTDRTTKQKNFNVYVLGRILWRMPFPFGIAKLLGPSYSLRSVLFHDIADKPSEFTNGIGTTMGKQDFEAGIRFLSKHYTPVGLSDILTDSGDRKYARPPVLMTFDDAYASVAREAAPILQRYGVPAIFFVNAASVGNHDLILHDLVCYVANTLGLQKVRSVAREVANCDYLELGSLEQVFSEFVATLSQTALGEFRTALASAAGIRTADLARQAQMYVDAEQLRSLSSFGIEIGSHTYSHVFCRSLRGDEFEREIYANKTILEDITGMKVRAFSVPYGSSADLTEELVDHLRRSGHEAVFLAESRSNNSATDRYRINRVSVHARTDAEFFAEVEVLPRLRSIRDFLF